MNSQINRHRFLPRVSLVLSGALLVLSGAMRVEPARAAGSVPRATALPPIITSWATQNSSRYARVVEQRGTSPVATWPSQGLLWRGGGQSVPVYADIQQVSYSADWVYVQGTGLASHQMGPWYDGINHIFGNWPSNQSYIRRFPRAPQAAPMKSANGMGDIGTWVNGVALFNMLDAAHYDSSIGYEVMGPPMQQQDTAFWERDAVPVEGRTFDSSNAHQPEMGTYHYHSNPLGLRYQLGDNVDYDRAADRYHESAAKLHHSPILGWAYDGFPIYGPYGCSDPKDPASGIRRMISGYVIRNGSFHTVDLRETGRHSLGKWAEALHHTGETLNENQYGPDVSVRYPLGRYCEDYDHLGDLGYTQGKDFDLDRYNGRFCVTPDYPQGTYAYFVTLNGAGGAVYPYVIGRQYYGTPSGGPAARVSEAVTVYHVGGVGTAIHLTTAAASGGTLLQWTSVEGGHYKVETVLGGSGWKTLAEDVRSGGQVSEYRVAHVVSADAAQFRVTVASLDPYDTTAPHLQRRPGGRGGPGGGPPGGGPPGGGPPGGGGPPDGGLPGGGAPAEGQVGTVIPAVAKAGTAFVVQIKIQEPPQAPPSFVQPTSASIGNLRAQKVTWDGQTVVAQFSLPPAAKPGLYKVQVVFPGPPDSGFNVTFTAGAAFTVQAGGP